jgi:phospholipid/cholesterol/gamma-HCH transport system substrate-binding protein
MAGAGAGWLRRRLQRLRARKGFARDLAIVGVIMVLGVATAGYILIRQGVVWPWEQREILYADFTNAPGVAPGQDQQVRIAGVPVGVISGATTTKQGFARLTLSLQPGTKIYSNAHILMQAGNPLNQIYLDVNPGGPPGHLLRPGSTIPAVDTNYPIQLGQILQHLGPAQLSGVTALLSAANSGLAGSSTVLPGDLNAVTVTFDDLKPVASALATRQDLLRQLVGDLTTIAQAVGGNSGRLASLVASAKTTLNTLAANDQALAATINELPGTTTTLQATLEKVTALTSQIDPALQAVKSVTGQLPSTLQQLTRALSALHSTVTDAAPAVNNALPVVEPLRALTANLEPATANLAAIGPDLNPITQYLVSYLPWLQAFVYNTNSVTSTQDANGPILRGLLQVSPNSLPISNPLESTAGPARGGSKA